MNINFLLVIFGILLLFCIVRGARKGMLRILFGMVAWIALIIFVNYCSPVVADLIKNNSGVSTQLETVIDSNLHTKYEKSEEEKAGSGEEAILSILPEKIRTDIENTVHSSIDNLIKVVAEELAFVAIKGIATVLVIAIGILLIVILDKLLKGLGFIPGIRDVNKFFGIVAGAFEGILIIWIIMYIADCFPTSEFGRYVLSNSQADQILIFVYKNNLIERIIGI